MHLRPTKPFIVFLLVFFISTLFFLPIAQANLADSLLNLLNKEKNDSLRVDLMIKLSREWWYKDSRKAISWGLKAIREAQKLNYKKGIASGANVTGVGYDVMGLPDSAIFYYDIALSHAQGSHFEIVAGSALSNKAMIMQSFGKYTEAIQLYHAALAIFEKLDNQQMIANVNNNIGLTYEDLRQHQKALEYYLRSLGIRRKLKDESGVATSLNNLALVYQEMGKYAKALEYLFEAAELRIKLKDDYGLGIVYNNIAEIYSLLGDYRKTIQYNELSLMARRRTSDETGKSYNFNNLVNAYLKLGNLQSARMFLDSSLQLVKRLKALPRMVKTWEFKISWHKAAGQKDSVIKAYEEYITLKDSLARKTLEEEIAHTEARYGVMQKTAEVNRLNQLVQIQQLEAENARTKARNTRLFGIIILGIILSIFGAVTAHLRYRARVMLERQRLDFQQKTFLEVMAAEDRERQRIAMELHDGLGQVLSAALLNIRALPEQASSQGYGPRKSAEKAIQTAIEDMRRISHNLMPGALIRKGLTHAIEEMAQTVNSSQKAKINLQLDNTIELPRQTQHTLYRVIQETINNILKHSKATEITISLKTENNRFSLEIRDNGNCLELPQEKPEKSIGLESLKQRINLLKGIWSLQRTCEEQNLFKIEFSLSES